LPSQRDATLVKDLHFTETLRRTAPDESDPPPPLDVMKPVGGRHTTQNGGQHMSQDEREDTTIYKVVVNHEEQYSIWPADRENALGWNDAGKSGTKADCLAYIEEVWTDMRPLSLRKKMEADAG
jgi:MbtH protein